MGWESFGVVKFDLGPLLLGQTGIAKLKVLITQGQMRIAKISVYIFVFLEVCSVTPTYSKSWAKNLLIWSDFTLGFSFKVKRCYNGFGEFSSGGYNLHRFSDALGLVISKSIGDTQFLSNNIIRLLLGELSHG